MKHIKTADAAETAMRKRFPVVTDERPITAEGTHAELVRRIVELTRQADLIKLEISKATGVLMGYMQGHAELQDEGRNTLVSWKNGSSRPSVDYDGIILEMNIPPAVIARHTTSKAGSRIFTIMAD